jgi:hypothetical protein
MSYEMLESLLESPVELTDAELDAVAAGAKPRGGGNGSQNTGQVGAVNVNLNLLNNIGNR